MYIGPILKALGGQAMPYLHPRPFLATFSAASSILHEPTRFKFAVVCIHHTKYTIGRAQLDEPMLRPGTHLIKSVAHPEVAEFSMPTVNCQSGRYAIGIEYYYKITVHGSYIFIYCSTFYLHAQISAHHVTCPNAEVRDPTAGRAGPRQWQCGKWRRWVAEDSTPNRTRHRCLIQRQVSPGTGRRPINIHSGTV